MTPAPERAGTPPQVREPDEPPASAPLIETRRIAPAAAPPVGPAPDLWQKARELAAGQPSLLVLLESLSLARCEGGVAVVEPVKPGQGAYLKARAPALEDLLSRAAGKPLRLEVREPAPESGGGGGPTAPNAGADSEAYAKALQHPLVRRAAELLGARLVKVEREGAPVGAAPTDQGAGETTVDAPAPNAPEEGEDV